MPRRSIERTAPEPAKMVNMKTGELEGRSALPVICERIRYYRERAGLEQKALAKLAGVTPNAVSNWENGRGRPDINLLPELCEALGITMYDLFGIVSPVKHYSEDEIQLVRQYRELSAGHKVVLNQLIDSLIKVQAAEDVPLIRKLTHFARSLAAGFADPTEFEGEGEPIYLYTSREVDRADCVFSVNGDSMEPVYHDGDMVLVSRIPDAPILQPGEVGAFVYGNETYIKVYEKDGLHSLNPNYKPLHFDESESVYLIGRVMGIIDESQVASTADVEKYLMLHPEG